VWDEDAGHEKFGAVLALKAGRVLHAFFIFFELLLLLFGLNSSVLKVFQSRRKVLIGLNQLLPADFFRFETLYIMTAIPLKLLNMFS
jgi:hypothetical protein